MRWAVQYLGADRRWRLIVNSCSESRAEAVVSLRERRRVSQDEDFRLVRLTTKSEKLRMAIVKELRARADDQAIYDAEDESPGAHASRELKAAADRIERDEARAALATARGDALERLLAIEEQAKRVARAEKWLRWARTADAETDDDAWGAVVSAADTLRAERRKLAEMVGEGDET